MGAVVYRVVKKLYEDEPKYQSKQDFTAFMCPDPWQPKGICDGLPCDAGITVDTRYKSTGTSWTVVSNINNTVATLKSPLQTASPKIKKIYVTQRVAKVESLAGKKVVTQYIAPVFSDPITCLLPKACSEIENYAGAMKWRRVYSNRENQWIIVDIPVPQTCGLDRFNIYFHNGWQEIYPGKNGEITSTVMRLASGEIIEHEFSETARQIVAGMDYLVFFRMRGFSTEHWLGYFKFETENMTSSVVLGCGLWENDQWVHGGRGEEWYDFYAGEPERFFWLVSYRGREYRIRAVDNAPHTLGSTVFIGKNILSQSIINSLEMTESAATDTLSESADAVLNAVVCGFGGETDDD